MSHLRPQRRIPTWVANVQRSFMYSSWSWIVATNTLSESYSHKQAVRIAATNTLSDCPNRSDKYAAGDLIPRGYHIWYPRGVSNYWGYQITVTTPLTLLFLRVDRSLCLGGIMHTYMSFKNCLINLQKQSSFHFTWMECSFNLARNWNLFTAVHLNQLPFRKDGIVSNYAWIRKEGKKEEKRRWAKI